MEKKKISRKKFLAETGRTGIAFMLGTQVLSAEQQKMISPDAERKNKAAEIPKRKLGRAEVSVPVLSHGIMYNLIDRQIVLHQGLRWGINHLDTSHSYAGGNSELGIGLFLKRHPEKRKDLFIVSKASGADTPDEAEERLQTSLKRMNTAYIDLYYGVHGLSRPAKLTPELKAWADGAKKRKLIRYFGFSTHRNMAECLAAASKLDWIDAVMFSYNFRLMQDPEIEKGVEMCHRAGTGLIAMKVMGHSIKSTQDRELTAHFLKKGFTEGQAKLKAVLSDKRITAACVTMDTSKLIAENASAALDLDRFSRGDLDYLIKYASRDSSPYCSACGLCDASCEGTSDILRYLMYYNSYGDTEMARGLFAEMPAHIRNRISSFNFTDIEGVCPGKLPLASLVSEALARLC